MEYSQMIYEFVDGSLELEHEGELFLALSSNEELRSELKQNMAIKTAIKTDTAAFSPLPKSTMNIYKSLGFAAPAATGGSASVSRPARLWGKYSQGITGGLASAAATVIIMLLLLKPGNSDIDQYSGYAEKHGSGDIETIIQNDIPVTDSHSDEALADGAEPQKETIKTVIKYVPVYIEVESGQQKASYAKATQDQNEISPLNYSAPEKQNLSIASPRFTEGKEQLMVQGPGLNDIASLTPELEDPDKGMYQYHSLSAEFRGTQSWDMPETSLNPEKYQAFNNIAAAIFWEYNDELHLGGEYRRENFYQEFEGKKQNGDLYEFAQNPNLSYIGFALRYKPEWLSTDNLNPYGQVSLGGTTAGPILRGMIGGEYNFAERVSFVFGLEWNYFRYQHQGNWWSSQKWGAHYGINYRIY